MKLDVLLEQLVSEGLIEQIRGSKTTEVTGLVYDTRTAVSEGNLFVCIAGAVFDPDGYYFGPQVSIVAKSMAELENLLLKTQ